MASVSKQRFSFVPLSVSVLLAGLAAASWAQPSAAAPTAKAMTTVSALTLDFDAARQRMQQSSDQLAASQAAVESARLQTKALQGLGGPVVGLSAGVARYDVWGTLDLTGVQQSLNQQLEQFGQSLPVPIDFAALAQQLQALNIQGPNLPSSVPWNVQGTATNVAITGVWPIYTGGLTTAVKGFSAAMEAEARADAATGANQLDGTLVQRYFTAQLARRAAQLREQAANTVAEHDRAAERMLQVGVISRVERLQASVALEDARRQALKAQGDAALAFVALQRLLKSDQPVVPSSPLFVISKPIESLSHFQELAQHHHPGLEKVAAKKAQAEQLHAAGEARWKPTVALFGRAQAARNSNLWMAGAMANWTLWSAVDRNAMAQSSAQKVLQAEHTDAQVRSDIGLLVEKNWRAVEDARRQYLAMAPGLQLAQELIRLRTSGLREGTSNTMDLIDAQTNHTKIETERAQAANTYVQALAQLLDSAGVPDQFTRYMQQADVRIGQ